MIFGMTRSNALLQPWIVSLSSLLGALDLQGRNPRLEELRWRLHQRLLLVAAGLCAAFFALNLGRGHWDETGVGLLLCLGAWAWLRKHPAHSRIVARLNLLWFLGMGAFAIFGLESPAVHWALLAMTIMPVFGALLDGPIGGGVAALATVACAIAALATGQTYGMPLGVAFAIPATLCLFSVSLGHTWLFYQFVERRQQSAQALAATTAATERLARTLSDDVIQATAGLRRSLQTGWDDGEAAQALRQVLTQSRQRLPAALPRNSVDPQDWLTSLRGSTHRFFLGVAFLAALTALAAVLWMGFPLWELAAVMATITAMLLWLGDTGSPRWRWRLDAFVLACLAVMGADVLLSATAPAASLLFLPLVVFYAGMLGPAWMGPAAWAAGSGLLALAWRALPPLPGHGIKLLVLGLTSLTLMAISLATLPLYRRLLEELKADEDRLHGGLQAFRRLMSTLFHDLANPLAVLLGLAALPAQERQPGDLERARRMVERLQAVSEAARRAANRQDPDWSPLSAGHLADSLVDIFRERLDRHDLQLQRGDGMDLPLRQGGSVLRDSILGNLLSNAIKFSPAGGVIRFSAQRRDGGVCLRLQDAGPGFPAQTLQDLSRGSAPKPRPGQDGEQGSGFGLLLAQSYAKDLGGRLTLSNPTGGGALVELWLPD
jgi:signal transduction histidine kinase